MKLTKKNNGTWMDQESKNKVSSIHIAGLVSLRGPSETIWHHGELPLSSTWPKAECFSIRISLSHSWETASRHFGDQSPAWGQAFVMILKRYWLMGSLHPMPACRSLSPSDAAYIPWKESLCCGVCALQKLLRTTSEWLFQFQVLLNW